MNLDVCVRQSDEPGVCLAVLVWWLFVVDVVCLPDVSGLPAHRIDVVECAFS